MNENAAGFLLLFLLIVLATIIAAIMSYVTVWVVNSPLARGKPKGVATVLGLAWFVALSDCALPVALLVSSDNPVRWQGVTVIVALALYIGIIVGIATVRLPQLHES